MSFCSRVLVVAAGGGAGGGLAADVDEFFHADPVVVKLGADEGVDAVIAGLFLDPDHFDVARVEFADFGEALGVEGVDLFEPEDGDVGDVLFAAFGEQVVVDFAGADEDAADFGLVDVVGFVNPVLEASGGSEFVEGADGEGIAEHALGAHDDQWAAVGALGLSAEQVEILRGRGGVADDHVVFSAELQEAFEAGVGMFGAHAFVAVGEEHDEAVVFAPFGFAGADELVDHLLAPVDEVAELGFPDDEGVGVGGGEAVFKADAGELAEHGVNDHEAGLVAGDVGEGDVRVAVLVVEPDGVAVGEGSAGDILAGDSDPGAFVEQRSEGEHFATAPVDALLLGDGLEAIFHHAADGFVDVETIGDGGGDGSDFFEGGFVDAGIEAPVVAFGEFEEVRPRAVNGRRGVGRLEVFGVFESFVEALAEVGGQGVDFRLSHDAGFDEAFGVEFADGGMAFDFARHHGLGHRGIIEFVVAAAAVTDEVNDHIAFEFLTKGHGEACGVHHGFGVVSVHMENRGLNGFGDVGGVTGEAAIAGVGGEADLVVDDDVQRAAGAVGFEF